MKNKKVAIAIFAAIFFLGNFSFSRAIEYGMLGGKPANPDSNVENSDSWFIYSLNAGEKKEDAIQVMNLFAEPNSILLYAADTTPSSSGGFALKQFSEPKDEVGGWVKFYPDAVPEALAGIFASKGKKIVAFCALNREELEKEFIKTKKKLTDDDSAKFGEWCAGKSDLKIDLKGNERLTVPFVFSVPERADVGEHTGGILIQKVSADDAQAAGSSVKLTTRVGVRIYETVPGDIIRKISVESSSFFKNYKEFDFSNWFKKKEDRKAEEMSFNVRIKNEGNASATVRDVIHVKDRLFGKRSMDVDDRSFQVMKNDVFVSNFSWNNPRFGRFSVEREIKYLDVANQEHVIRVEPVSFWIIPWREMAAALLLLVLIAAVYAGWKYFQKKKYGGIGWVEYAIKKNDTVATLAEKYKIDWQVLTKTNRLKAPYLLSVGQIILVPATGKGKKAAAKKIVAKVGEEKPAETPVIVEKADAKKKSKAGRSQTTNNKMDALVKLASRKRVRPESLEQKIWGNQKTIWWVAGVVLVVVMVIVVGVWLAQRSSKEATINAKISLDSPVSPQPSPEKTASVVVPPMEEKIDKAQLMVKILNEGAAAGLAGKVKTALAAEGYAKAEASNGLADNVVGNFIYYSADKFKEQAGAIDTFLQTKKIKAAIGAAQADEQKSGDIVIILGK